MLERVPLAGLTVIADKGLAGAEFEGWMADRGAEFLRPDRKDEPLRFGSLGRVRQWIESVFWTCKGQLGLERHGARTLPGLCARVGLRLLALAAGLRHTPRSVNLAGASAPTATIRVNHLGVKPRRAPPRPSPRLRTVAPAASPCRARAMPCADRARGRRRAHPTGRRRA